MDTPLGNPVEYTDGYDPRLLTPLPRAPLRREIGLAGSLPFAGEDVWHGYEFSWLTTSGMPCVRVLRLRVDVGSPCIVESKSLKLYLNGYAQTRFDLEAEVAGRLAQDLDRAFGTPISVELLAPDALRPERSPPGVCLDHQVLAVDRFERTPELLDLDPGIEVVAASLYTDLFRSLCPVTGQPDWATVCIRYQGPAMDRAALLRYLISYRRHQAFHETTVEQIFLDLKARCQPERLLVAGAFLRRGGLDINPMRTDATWAWPPLRLIRQ
jgi:7-cyano-7-deazaguanine reductase